MVIMNFSPTKNLEQLTAGLRVQCCLDGLSIYTQNNIPKWFTGTLLRANYKPSDTLNLVIAREDTSTSWNVAVKKDLLNYIKIPWEDWD